MKRTLTLLLLLAGVTGYAQKNKLQLNLKQDRRYYLNTQANLTITQDIPGQKQVITTLIGGKAAHKVVAIKDTVYELAMQYESLSIEMEIGGKRMMSINTELKGDDIMSKIMATILHKPITVFLSRTGKVLNIIYTDNLYNGMFDAFPEIAADKKAQLKAQMQKSFGGENLKNNFQDAFAVLPQKPVGVNDAWAGITNMKTVAAAKITTAYFLKDVTDRAYVIHGEAVARSTRGAQLTVYSGQQMRYS